MTDDRPGAQDPSEPQGLPAPTPPASQTREPAGAPSSATEHEQDSQDSTVSLAAGPVAAPPPEQAVAAHPSPVRNDGPTPDGSEVTVEFASPETPREAASEEARRKRISGAGVLIGVLLALFGFTLVVQVRSNANDSAYASAREGDLLQIMSDLDAAERRLNQDVVSLEQTKRELQSGAAGRDAALAEAKARADALGILAGTLKARGKGVTLSFYDETGKIKAGTLLNAVQELRGAGAEALQIDGAGGSVRIIASTSFVDADGGVRVDGRRLTGPYTIRAIGDPAALKPAMEIAGGVVAATRGDGGNVIVSPMEVVEINEVRPTPDLEYARPVR